MSDNDPINLYSQLFAPGNPPVLVLPVHPYVLQCPSVRYEFPHDYRETTVESMHARCMPVPMIESQTKPPAKFKGEEKSFVKVDVFLKKLERYLRVGHGLDLKNDDVTDRILDNFDGFVYCWFDTLCRPLPYLFSQFDRDLQAYYVPVDYQMQLLDQYKSTN